MGPIVLKAFAGMIPVSDSRLLPDNAAEDCANFWLYAGRLEGIRDTVDVHTLANPNARYVFRVPKGNTISPHVGPSYWLEFSNINTTVEKTPVRNAADPTYYWADGTNKPGYTSLSRLAAGQDPLILGIPAPSVAPSVSPSGGVGLTESRTYVYTWVSSYGEEGPPSPPSGLTSGKIDDVWALGLTGPSVADTTDRDLTHVNIYRTLTNSQGIAEFRFVVQLPITTTAYIDNIAVDVVAANDPLETELWEAPPADLEGIVSMPNGILAGWRGTEVWFCEPYRPHAWPSSYTLNVDYPIVGMGALQQMLVVGTKSHPYTIMGTHPSNMTIAQGAYAEPCVARGSMVTVPEGVLYASPNGLILVSQGGLANVTRSFISKDDWASLLNLEQLRAGLLNGAYFVFSGVREGAFQVNAFQNSAFQMKDEAGTRDGGLIDHTSQGRGFVRLTNATPTYNVIQDVWTGELFVIRDGKVKQYDLTNDVNVSYLWRSKIFQLPKPDNLGACKVTWSYPLGVDPGTATTTMRIYANGSLKQTKVLPSSGNVFRMKSGFLAQNYQFEFEGNLRIHQVEIAGTVKELQSA